MGVCTNTRHTTPVLQALDDDPQPAPHNSFHAAAYGQLNDNTFTTPCDDPQPAPHNSFHAAAYGQLNDNTFTAPCDDPLLVQDTPAILAHDSTLDDAALDDDPMAYQPSDYQVELEPFDYQLEPEEPNQYAFKEGDFVPAFLMQEPIQGHLHNSFDTACTKGPTVAPVVQRAPLILPSSLYKETGRVYMVVEPCATHQPPASSGVPLGVSLRGDTDEGARALLSWLFSTG